MSENNVAVKANVAAPKSGNKGKGGKAKAKRAASAVSFAVAAAAHAHTRGGTGAAMRSTGSKYGACGLIRWLAANEYTNSDIRYIFDQIGFASVNDFTIGCQAGATRSAMGGVCGKRSDGTPISKADAAKGVSFRGEPAEVSAADAAEILRVWKGKPQA
jgi:hypothetical protein